jgi:hypothetical protein
MDLASPTTSEGKTGLMKWDVLIDEMLAAMARAAVLDDDSKRDNPQHAREIDRIQAIRAQILDGLASQE